MCGILGYSNISLKLEHVGRVRKAFKRLLVNTSTRGVDATGAYIPGKPTWFSKAPLPAAIYTNTKGYDDLLNEHFTVNSPALVGHCRHATNGTPQVNDNNHPVVAGNIMLVHNGVIWNNKELVADWKEAPEVDTVAIAHVLDKAMLYEQTHTQIEAALSQHGFVKHVCYC